MQRWEYKRGIDLTDDQLDELGEQGWELVAIAFDEVGPSPDQHNVR
jgi:hypothetical protein